MEVQLGRLNVKFNVILKWVFESGVVMRQSCIGPTGEVELFCAMKEKSLVGTLAMFAFHNLVRESAGE